LEFKIGNHKDCKVVKLKTWGFELVSLPFFLKVSYPRKGLTKNERSGLIICSQKEISSLVASKA